VLNLCGVLLYRAGSESGQTARATAGQNILGLLRLLSELGRNKRTLHIRTIAARNSQTQKQSQLLLLLLLLNELVLLKQE
jgi:hypothetical protein